jgi:hydrogenase expression/formation protein HypC
MCLAVPGRIERITEAGPLMRVARVDFGGVTREVNLACVPEAALGDYVLVHVGFALSVIDPAEAERIFGYLREIEAL